MGKSRSATVLLAYLLWSSRQPSGSSSTNSNEEDSMVSIPRKPLSVIDALTLLRQGRPIAEPNEGFMDQLYLYVDMGCPTTQSQLDNHKLYRRWMNKRNVEESLRINRAPDMVDILFEDESPDEEDDDLPAQAAKLSMSDKEDQEKVAPGVSAPSGMTPPTSELPSSSETTIKCRRCRHLLARSAFIIPHEPAKGDPSATSCAHIFLHPLSWMKGAFSEGQLEGRLICPNKKCGQNVGKFAWQGLRCSCGKWVTPGFGVARGKVDEVTASALGDAGRDSSMGSAGGGPLRLPPGMRKQGKI